MGFSCFFNMQLLLSENSFALSVEPSTANNYPNRTSEPVCKTSLSQQIGRALTLCLFNYGCVSRTFGPAGILMCFHQRWRPAASCTAQSHFLLCLFNPVFISPRSSQSSSYLLRLCSSHPSMLIPAFSPPAGSHFTLQLSLSFLPKGAGLNTCILMLCSYKILLIQMLFNLYFTIKVLFFSGVVSCYKFILFCQ